MKPIYLDYNATTPIDPRVARAMLPFINEHFGNPSSSHIFGVQSKQAVEEARRKVADMLHARVNEIIFTSGGSESNNYAIKGAAWAYREKGNHIITSSIEHPAVIEVCRYLEQTGFKVTYLPVDSNGLLDAALVEEAVNPQTILISVMHANNEVGTIQPIAQIAEIAHKHGVLLHTDCAQSVGKIPVWVDELGVDLLSVAGHKLYAPKGIGALYIRSGIHLQKQIHGADHERNLRAGTENVIEIVGLGKACELVGQKLEAAQAHLQNLRDRLEKNLLQTFPESRINGHPQKRLPNTSSLSFKGLEAGTIVAELSQRVAVSAGAACHSNSVEVSSVLEAMQVPLEFAMGTVRFSVGRFSTSDEIDRALAAVKKVVTKLQPASRPFFLNTGRSEVKLTHYTHGLGCACKLRPQLLEEVLRQMPLPKDKNILVGLEAADDAAIYQINEQQAIVQTVDFFTPVVDDPFQFGAIAAANSLSDIYAMGGQPLFALNIAGFPSNRLSMDVFSEILRGAQSVAEKAGIAIIGGHTVDDTEPKFGLAVSGIIDPKKIVKNSGARPGDALILTKGLGTGILSTALKRGLLNEAQTALLTQTMSCLNKKAAQAMLQSGVHAATDVTGFGLLGHLLEMLKASGVAAELTLESIPFLEAGFELAAAGVVPGGSKDNQSFTAGQVSYQQGISEAERLLLNDAQTAGGLLIAVAENNKEILLKRLRQGDSPKAACIGTVVTGRPAFIRVLRQAG